MSISKVSREKRANFNDKVKMYDFAAGPYPCRVHIALYEKKLHEQVEYQTVDIFKGEHKQEWFKKINYSCTLPVIEFDNGTYLMETTSIIDYIDKQGHNPGSLSGYDPLEQATILMMTRRVELQFLEPLSYYLHHATPGLGPDTEEYQNKEWGVYQREKGLKGAKYINDFLEKNDYIAGDRFTQADIACIGGMVLAKMMLMEIPQDHQALWRWYNGVSQRESVHAYHQYAA